MKRRRSSSSGRGGGRTRRRRSPVRTVVQPFTSFKKGFKHQGLYEYVNGVERKLLTKVPDLYTVEASGRLTSVPDGRFDFQNGDGTYSQYREWDPFVSNFAAAILGEVKNIWLRPGYRVLYLARNSSITVSHVSDLVGPAGIVYAVGPYDINLVTLSNERSNVVPIFEDPRKPASYEARIRRVDVIISEEAREYKAEAIAANASMFLRRGGKFIMFMKALFKIPLVPDEVEFEREVEESYSIDVEGSRILPNVDDVGLRLNSFSAEPCGSRHVTGDVCTGATLHKCIKCNILGVNYECNHKSTMLSCQPSQTIPPTTNAEGSAANAPTLRHNIIPTQMPGTEDLSMIDDNCQTIIPQHLKLDSQHLPLPSDLREVTPSSNESIRLHSSANQSPEDFSAMADSRQQITTDYLTYSRQHLPLLSDSHAAAPSSNEKPSNAANIRHSSPHLCEPGSSSNESAQGQPIPTNDVNLNPSMSGLRHRRQGAVHTSSTRNQQRGKPRNRDPPSRQESFQKSGHGLRADIVANLIDVLDEHNELVQLFRTTRNKMADANIPQFKVRLFGVVGSRQHELPTDDSIGAIVFEGGPDVETDLM
ncbi:fibrillarin [Artemisia annua]|uniref:rRNA 2'-O-methyltransferase fibrillarin n=1 Tax=Artemisia annua TaxID=35608 RepID=A0A2U1PTL5_ARTAN|nr:fibrillarin [Artemisia annua]